MSLRRSPRRTSAFLAANRRNAKKSTGPRTARGKAQTRLNGLRSGARSALYDKLFYALSTGPIGAVDETAATVLTPEMAAHPLFGQTVRMFREMEPGDPVQSALDWDRDTQTKPTSAIRPVGGAPRLGPVGRERKTFQSKPECY